MRTVLTIIFNVFWLGLFGYVIYRYHKQIWFKLKFYFLSKLYIHTYKEGLDLKGLSGDSLLQHIESDRILSKNKPMVRYLWQFKEVNDRYSKHKINWWNDFPRYLDEINDLIPPRGTKYRTYQQIESIVQSQNTNADVPDGVKRVVCDFFKEGMDTNTKIVQSLYIKAAKVALSNLNMINQDMSITKYLKYITEHFSDTSYIIPSQQAVSKSNHKISEQHVLVIDLVERIKKSTDIEVVTTKT